MQPKTIPLRALQDALMCTMIRIKTRGWEIGGKPHGRTAAYTQNPNLNISCRDALWGYKPFPPNPSNFSPMSKGDMEGLLKKVRMHGLPEVRKTFGAGMKALQAEFADGVMR